MEDTYTPPIPDTATCPYCATPIAGAATINGAVLLAMLHCCCPRCGGEWEELRAAQSTRRYWAPDAVGADVRGYGGASRRRAP